MYVIWCLSEGDNFDPCLATFPCPWQKLYWMQETVWEFNIDLCSEYLLLNGAPVNKHKLPTIGVHVLVCTRGSDCHIYTVSSYHDVYDNAGQQILKVIITGPQNMCSCKSSRSWHCDLPIAALAAYTKLQYFNTPNTMYARWKTISFTNGLCPFVHIDYASLMKHWSVHPSITFFR